MQNVKVTAKGLKGPAPARIFMLFARKAPAAVIFRRGPSKWVQLISWNTRTEVFEPGQWFHGRIYERRSDLSPDGTLLIYFAQRISGRNDPEYTYAWTAISKPQFLTALALWPKGDCWHGGGLFQRDRVALLNHKPNVAKPHPKHKPHRSLRVIPNKNAQGEDDPIFSQRLERDGWSLRQSWKVESGPRYKYFHTAQPEVREKFDREGKFSIRLTRSIERLDYSEEFSCWDSRGALVEVIERASWAEWDQQGRLVYARDGKIYSARCEQNRLLAEELLIDLNSSTPKPVATPEWAQKW